MGAVKWPKFSSSQDFENSEINRDFWTQTWHIVLAQFHG